MEVEAKKCFGYVNVIVVNNIELLVHAFVVAGVKVVVVFGATKQEFGEKPELNTKMVRIIPHGKVDVV
jgi:hypothetical protein